MGRWLPGKIYRAKGLAYTSEVLVRRVLFQIVGGAWTLQ
jgi:hypothetical protein